MSGISVHSQWVIDSESEAVGRCERLLVALPFFIMQMREGEDSSELNSVGRHAGTILVPATIYLNEHRRH